LEPKRQTICETQADRVKSLPQRIPARRDIRGVGRGMSLTKVILVPLFMFLSSALMATAWLGHLRFRDQIGFWTALGASWLLVLPEYILNVAATRFGYGTFSGAQMASFHLSFGVVCVALVSHFVLNERISVPQILGFVLLAASIVLITYRR
jgi:uncharacterized protein (DUF486 family)